MHLWLLASLVVGDTLPLVVIDPGHGGDAEGAVGVCGVREKDVTLAIAREMAQVLQASGRARVLLTRRDDTSLDLETRPELANQAGATLFISVHANASTRPEARGVETFFLSPRSVDRRVAQLTARENEGAVAPTAAPESTLEQILGGLTLSAAHAESQRLALRLQHGMNADLEDRGRGVLQAPFIVLAGARMAAALVEVGFLSNADECRALGELEHQRKTAHALAAAILGHLLQEERLYARR